MKATAQVETVADRGWGGSGFETVGQDWLPLRPDIQEGDWVYFESDDGYSNAMRVGAISASLDSDFDTVSGSISVPWFSQALNGRC